MNSAKLRQTYDILTRCIAKGRPCPTNEALADELQFDSASSSARYLRKLEEAGLIQIQTSRSRNRRTVLIVETGKVTVPQSPPVPKRRSESKKRPVCDAAAQRRARDAKRAELGFTGDHLSNGTIAPVPPAKTCQWPSGDGPSYEFCGAEVYKGSYCAEHWDKAHRPRGSEEEDAPE